MNDPRQAPENIGKGVVSNQVLIKSGVPYDWASIVVLENDSPVYEMLRRIESKLDQLLEKRR